MGFAESKKYLCTKCSLNKNDEEILKRIYPNSEIIDWIKFSTAHRKIEKDSYVIEKKSFSNRESEKIFIETSFK